MNSYFFKIKFLLLLILTIKGIYSIDQIIYVYAFDSYQSIYPKKMILVGEIKSKVKAAEIKSTESPIKEYDTRKDIVTVKVINKKGIKVGQTLYVVYKDSYHEKFKNAFIMGEIKVTAILNHPFYGLVLTGVGNLLRVREGFYVVRTLESENIEKAYFLKRKGDSYLQNGNYEQAIKEYLKAIQQDTDLVEAHFSLANIYYLQYKKEGSSIALQNALKEFQISWDLKDRFRYNNEFFDFLFSYFSALLDYFVYYKKNNIEKNSKENYSILQQMINIGNECELISDDIECKMAKSIGMYYLMNFYSDESTKENRTLNDKYKFELGMLLKHIEEYFSEKNYIKYKEFQEGRINYINRNIDIVQFEYIFIQYYYQLYKELLHFEKYKEREKLKSLLKKHIQIYFQYAKDKPEYHDQNLKILSIKNSIES
ncbi:MAG: hypothetical protein KatS3mg129_2736 [Leptospiraceae bacterium]|nr:MAG: hypothetical protein KatS3mg129_2736 [Leptospiraceae bacterium]